MPSSTTRPIGMAALLLAAFAAQAAAGKPAPGRHAPARECRPAEPSFFRDQGLTMKLTTKLQFNKALLREKINAKVTGGAAMLWGGVSSREAIETAGRIAAQVDGIRCVTNLLKVGPPEAGEAPGGER